MDATISKELYSGQSETSLELMKNTASKIISSGGCCDGVSCRACCMGITWNTGKGMMCFKLSVIYNDKQWNINKVRLSQDFLNMFSEPKTHKVDIYD
jgi:hypothetical protein